MLHYYIDHARTLTNERKRLILTFYHAENFEKKLIMQFLS